VKRDQCRTGSSEGPCSDAERKARATMHSARFADLSHTTWPFFFWPGLIHNSVGPTHICRVAWRDLLVCRGPAARFVRTRLYVLRCVVVRMQLCSRYQRVRHLFLRQLMELRDAAFRLHHVCRFCADRRGDVPPGRHGLEYISG